MVVVGTVVVEPLRVATMKWLLVVLGIVGSLLAVGIVDIVGSLLALGIVAMMKKPHPYHKDW